MVSGGGRRTGEPPQAVVTEDEIGETRSSAQETPQTGSDRLDGSWLGAMAFDGVARAGIVGVVFVVQPARKAATPHPVEVLRG